MPLAYRRFKFPVFIFFVSLSMTAAWFDRQSVSANADDTAEFFEKRVRPILLTRCASCHNPQAQVAKLDLTTAEGFAKGGESGALINLSQPEESRLLKVIGYSETLKMPPTGKLKADEIAVLTEWVKMGAPWANATVKPEAKWNPPKSTREFTEEEKTYWAFQPLATVAPPKVKNRAWVKSPIDAFILQKLEARGITPAPPADKLTLLRRATFDLTGLPPTEKEMGDFLADNSPAAFAKVVERLLASPRYGEKWGRHWLDVARYADSTGNDEDHRYPHAWKYRDYVIEAFNWDLPYDQFIREQLAGDLLPAADGGEINKRGIVATGFLALGAKALAQQDKQKMLYDVWDEQVDVTSKAFLGMTMACARCHNHKFDPILTKDYYSLIGIFAATRSFTNPDSHVSVVLEKPLIPKSEWQQYQAAKKVYNEKQKRLQLALAAIKDDAQRRWVQPLANNFANIMLAARRVYEGNIKIEEAAKQVGLDAAFMQKWVDFFKPNDERVRGYLNEWKDAPVDKRSTVAQSYQARFVKRFEAWQKSLGEWQSKYQKALEANQALPDRPGFEEGEDRFFAEIYFGDSVFAVSDKEPKFFSTEQWAAIEKLHKEQEALKKLAPVEPEFACAIEEGAPVKQKVLVRGDYNNPGEDAPPAFPAILARYDTQSPFSGSGRLQLADWLTRAENPLPKRVLVNRLWQWHFGEGLVRTPDNFGRMGDRPSHTELLDFLAAEFIKCGYSMKAMHRMLMLSNTYKMASENPVAMKADPDNRLLSRFNRRRLTIEEMRDGLLAIDGTIDLTMGGTLQTGRGTDGENNQERLSFNPEKSKRRTVYLPLRRANLPTLLNLFDFGDATTMSGKRQLTNVATQALFWLNSEFLTERSADFAQLLMANNVKDEAERVAIAYRRILNREPQKAEMAGALKYLEGYKLKFAGDKAEQKAWQSFVRILMSSNEFVYLD
ncbi:MAG: PSD1 and planctomycete cytochrome C domain-containing protein [Acidobacteriota bacterium]